jgi:hypothetical protein
MESRLNENVFSARSKFVIRVIIMLAILFLVQATALFHESYCINAAGVEFDSNMGTFIFDPSNLLFRLDIMSIFLYFPSSEKFHTFN